MSKNGSICRKCSNIGYIYYIDMDEAGLMSEKASVSCKIEHDILMGGMIKKAGIVPEVQFVAGIDKEEKRMDIFLAKNPPKKCPYLLEHMVIKEERKINDGNRT